MWYVVQTKTGNENEIKEFIEHNVDSNSYGDCFIPMYEEVRRREDKCKILFRRLFPGYLFVDTDDPDIIFQKLKKAPWFTRLLGADDNAGNKTFIPVGEEDEEFLRTLLDDGIMHVSYIEMSKNNSKIEKIVGPLAKYRNHITKLEVRKREALVKTNMFGKERTIRFGLWKKDDPKLPWLEARMENGEQADLLDSKIKVDIGIYPGDKVKDTSGIYGEQVFLVDSVNPIKRTIKTKIELFNDIRTIELYADNVEKI